jgi:hypothetical protein
MGEFKIFVRKTLATETLPLLCFVFCNIPKCMGRVTPQETTKQKMFRKKHYAVSDMRCANYTGHII